MRYEKLNDAPDSDIVKLSLSMKQIRLVNKLIQAEIPDVEWGNSDIELKSIYSLADVFWERVHMPVSADEKKAAIDTENIARKPYLDALKAGDKAFKSHLAASRNGGQHD